MMRKQYRMYFTVNLENNRLSGYIYIYIFKLSERPRTASDARSARTRPAVQDVSSGSLSTSKEAFPAEGIIL